MRLPPRNAGTWVNYRWVQEEGEVTMTLTHGASTFEGEGDNMAQVTYLISLIGLYYSLIIFKLYYST